MTLLAWGAAPACAVDWSQMFSGSVSPAMQAHGGSRLSPEEVRKLEEKLARNPGDLQARTRLLGYYFVQGIESQEAKKERARHALYVIEHHPASEIAGLPYAQLLPQEDKEAYASGRALWLRHADVQSTSAAVLGNAARYFLVPEPESAERLLEKARALKPSSPELAALQGQLYSLHTRRGPLKQAPEKALAAYEEATTATANPLLKRMHRTEAAKAAFEAGEYDRARQLATELLKTKPGTIFGALGLFPDGATEHAAHILLGRLALRDGNTSAAREHLLSAGRVGSSPTLSSFGPNMALARDFLQRGEREIVLKYFELCSAFWKSDRLQLWTEQVRKGKIPDFGPNLNY